MDRTNNRFDGFSPFGRNQNFPDAGRNNYITVNVHNGINLSLGPDMHSEPLSFAELGHHQHRNSTSNGRLAIFGMSYAAGRPWSNRESPQREDAEPLQRVIGLMHTFGLDSNSHDQSSEHGQHHRWIPPAEGSGLRLHELQHYPLQVDHTPTLMTPTAWAMMRDDDQILHQSNREMQPYMQGHIARTSPFMRSPPAGPRSGSMFRGSSGRLDNHTHRVSSLEHRTVTADIVRNVVGRFGGATRGGYRARAHIPPQFHVASADDLWTTTDQIHEERRERWGSDVRQELESLLNGATLPDHRGVLSLGRLLPDGQRLPPNVEVSPYYLTSPSRVSELESVVREHFPQGPPLDRTLVVIHAPEPIPGGFETEVISFEDSEGPSNAGRLYMDLFTSEALLDLIHRTGVVPRVRLNDLDWAAEAPHNPDIGISRNNVVGLRSTQVVQTDLDDNGVVSCSICLEQKHVGETVTALPCNHFYCKDCIETWLRDNRTCPTCRNPVM